MNELFLESPLASLVVGICGAIFANSTGAGGGVVFVPLFHALGFSDAQAVSTSFVIQSYGMTTGAIAWSLYYRRQGRAQAWEAFGIALAITVPASIAGLWSVTLSGLAAPASLSFSFALFSVLLGAAILILAIGDRQRLRLYPDPADRVALAALAFIGGAVTAWLSVGVGEFVAFYLIARRFDVTEAVAVAVVVSAVTIWSGSPVHVFAADSEAVWRVALWAGPGAIIGALVARALALKLSAIRLKRFFGVWLLVIGVVEFL